MKAAVVLSISLLLTSISIYSYEIKSRKDATAYLKLFGYIQEQQGEYDNSTQYYLSTNKARKLEFTKALTVFQRFSGLKVNGKLDEETLKMMNKPRCGMPERMDITSNRMMTRKMVSHGIARRQRGWKSSTIFYRIDQYPNTATSGGLTDTLVKAEIKRAFQLWEDAANLKCVEVSNEKAQIEISFVVGEHGDGSAFGNISVGNVAAHAFFPDHYRFMGDIHFDDEKHWSARTLKGVNLYQVAAHEIGHALGLDHSIFVDSVMHMHLKDKIQSKFKLHQDDLMGIQKLYGKKRKAVSRMEKPLERRPAGGPVILYITNKNTTKENNALSDFWKCFSLLQDPKRVSGATTCYTNSVFKLVNASL